MKKFISLWQAQQQLIADEADRIHGHYVWN